jgi:hypothetical protein
MVSLDVLRRGHPNDERCTFPRTWRARRLALLVLITTVVIIGACTGRAASQNATRALASRSNAATPAPLPFVVGQPLSAGTHRSHVFATPVTFSVPDGWKVFEDEIGQFGLAELANDAPCVCVWRDVRLMSASCADEPDPAIGTSAEAIGSALAKRPGIVSTAPTAVSVGGLNGYTLDVSLDPAWLKPCPYSNGDPTVPTLVGSGISREVAWEVGPNHRQRLYLLDLPLPSQNVAINVEVCCGVGWDERMHEVAPVVASFSFGGS